MLALPFSGSPATINEGRWLHVADDSEGSISLLVENKNAYASPEVWVDFKVTPKGRSHYKETSSIRALVHFDCGSSRYKIIENRVYDTHGKVRETEIFGRGEDGYSEAKEGSMFWAAMDYVCAKSYGAKKWKPSAMISE